MSVRYQPVTWNRFKIGYDIAVLAIIFFYVYIFVRLGAANPELTRPIDGATLRMRAFGTCAFLLLTFILCIGPLARMDRRFLPLLYNRRHLGVITCAVAAVHATFVLNWYFNFSPVAKWPALLGSNTSYEQVLGFPFEALGLFALVVLLVMAVTSHDFWLSFLTPPVWKVIHISVYLAYFAVVLHVALGRGQSSQTPLTAIMVFAGAALVGGLHFAAALKQGREDRARDGSPDAEGWIDAGAVTDFQNNRARIVGLADGEQVAVFRYGDRISALTNACAHQNGPLGEGRIIDGCVTCPWHGFQYNPVDGCAPAPFTEKIATYNVKRVGARVLVHQTANAPGTPVDPLIIGTEGSAA
ncbi:MAG: Rieske 2Fe-2S domain-containing protein [Pseudomonadota bacterium]